MNKLSQQELSAKAAQMFASHSEEAFHVSPDGHFWPEDAKALAKQYCQQQFKCEPIVMNRSEYAKAKKESSKKTDEGKESEEAIKAAEAKKAEEAKQQSKGAKK